MAESAVTQTQPPPHGVRPPSLAGVLGTIAAATVFGFIVQLLVGVLPLWLQLGQLICPIAAIVAIVHVAQRHVAAPPDSQASVFCDGCGYEIGGPSITLCPECGGAAFARIAPPSPVARRWAHVAGVVTVLWAITVIAGQSYAAIITGGALFMPIAYAVLIAMPASLLVLVPMVLMQRTIAGRLAFPRTLGVLAFVLVSILATGWPHTLLWTMHQPAFDRLHARVQAGETIAVPHPIGVLRVRRIDPHPSGAVAYWTGPDRTGYIRVASGAQPPAYNAWSQKRLGARWWHHVDD